MKVPSYITQLTKADLAEIARACNIEPGNGIKLDVSEDRIKISIDGEYMKQAIWNFLKKGGASLSWEDVKYLPDL